MARRSKKLPHQTVGKMVRLYTEGYSVRRVAEATHVSENTAWRYLKEAGVEMRSMGGNQRPELHDEDDRVTQCVELYNSGKSSVEIGRELGIAHSTVTYRLRKAGIEVLSQQDSNRRRWGKLHV